MAVSNAVRRWEGENDMKLYYARGSSSLATRIVLLESGLPFDTVQVDEHTKVMEGGGDYRTVNPLGFVPALRLNDGTLLTEGAAISQYKADQVPEKGLAPRNGTIARTRMQAWLNFLSSELHKGGLTPLFNPAMPQEGIDIFRSRVASRLAHMDNHLSNNMYLLGDDFSAADAHCFVMLSWLNWVKIDLSSYPNLVAYHGRIGARPFVKYALNTEDLVPWPRSAP
jgi:glutathione S-transferase